MIERSITPGTVHLRSSWSSGSLLYLFAHALLFLSPKALWFPSSDNKISFNFAGVISCHSFTIDHQWAATFSSSKRIVREEARRRLTAIFSEPKGVQHAANFRHHNFANASVDEIQQRLAEMGVKFQQSALKEEPSMMRVPGCVSTVYVIATQEYGVDNEETTTNRISLRGNSDAILSRGLLSLLKDYIEQLTLEQILQLEPTDVADILGVRSALSKGRNDGLANMLKIIQNQLGYDGKREDDQIGNVITTEQENSTTIIPSSSSPETNPTVALLLSGGVDSSVALRLLLEEGYEVTPFYLKIWLEDELSHLGECPWEDDVNTCRQVCDQVGIDLQIIGLQEEYHQRVMQHTLNEAALGRTPNPDILCNSRVKFGCFLEYLKGLPNEFDYIASGHYAQIKRAKSNFEGEGASITRLFRAPDPVKDQSYFLCSLSQHQLSRLLFPIGHLEKAEVRQLAEKFQLPNRHRPDSQGLCFLGKVKFRDFMQINLGEKFGDLVDAVTGDIIGQHHGVWYHTVGQRKGIGPYLLPKATSKGPWYVVAKDPSKNIVYASNKYDEDVFVQSRSEFHVENLHWISGKEPTHLLDEGSEGNYRFILKIRHGPKLAAGTLEVLMEEDKDKNSDSEITRKRNGGIIKLDEKDGGLAPGQYVVFYTEDAECLGGGIISERHWAKFLLDTHSRHTVGASEK